MKVILIVTTLAAAIYFGMHKVSTNSTATATGIYSLSNVESTPIPNNTALLLWHERAKHFCSEFSAKDVEITKHTAEQCAERVNSKHIECATKVAPEYPSLISNKTDLKHMGKAYFDCTLPRPN
jgi:hypothetical protein